MDVGDAKIVISAQDKASGAMKQVGMSMDDMSRKATKAGMVMMAAGVAIMGAIFKMADSYTKAGDEVAKMAQRTGLGVETISELRHALMLSGSTIESFEKGFKRMASTIEDAKDGLSTAVIAFDKLGISVDDLEDMSPEEQFWAIANAIAEVEDPMQRSALAMDFFGQAGTAMLPMLLAGKKGIDDMRQAAHDANRVFTEESSAAAVAYQDAIFTLKENLAGLGAEIIEDIIPALEELVGKLTDVVGKITDWAAAHPELAEGLFDLGLKLVVGGAVLLGLAKFVSAIRAIVSALVIMHALTGPKGWAILAASIAAAAAGIGVIQKMGGESAWWEGIPDWAKILFPILGPPGWVDFPGGSSPPSGEHSAIPEFGRGMPRGNIDIHIGNFMGDETSLREFGRTIKDIISQDDRRTSFLGVNTLGYFPGSSAP